METSVSTTALGNASRFSPGTAALLRCTALSLPSDYPMTEWKLLGKHLYLVTDSSSW